MKIFCQSAVEEILAFMSKIEKPIPAFEANEKIDLYIIKITFCPVLSSRI